MRDEAALAELAAAHDEELSVDIHIADPQATRLPGAQTEAVAEGEDPVIGGSSALCPRVVGESGGSLNLPFSDTASGINLSAISGKIALVNNASLLTGTSPSFSRWIRLAVAPVQY